MTYKQDPDIVGYARKDELHRFLHDFGGTYNHIGLDHPECWVEEPPYERLTALYSQAAIDKRDELIKMQENMLELRDEQLIQLQEIIELTRD